MEVDLKGENAKRSDHNDQFNTDGTTKTQIHSGAVQEYKATEWIFYFTLLLSQ